MFRKIITALLIICFAMSTAAYASEDIDLSSGTAVLDAVQASMENVSAQEEGPTEMEDSECEALVIDSVAAEETSEPVRLPAVSFSSVSPFHDGEMPALDGESITAEAPVLMSDDATDVAYVNTLEDAAGVVRKGMRERQTAFPLYICMDRPLEYNDLKEIFTLALSHTGVPVEGDYIRWHYITYDCTANGFIEEGVYFYTISFRVAYYTTAEQEAAVDAKATEIIAGLNLNGKTNYERVLAIYDYLCENIVYDYDNLENDAYTLKYSSYAALVNGTSVCQGYASSFYRLCLEAGLDCRLIAGTAGDVRHGWNIVKLGDLYYNADPTYDAGESEYEYFLCGSIDFPDHTPMSEYSESSFTMNYPLGETAYVYTILGDVNGNGEVTNADAVLLLRHVSGWDVTWEEKASDVNQDKSVTISDYTILCRYMAGWDISQPIGHRT